MSSSREKFDSGLRRVDSQTKLSVDIPLDFGMRRWGLMKRLRPVGKIFRNAALGMCDLLMRHPAGSWTILSGSH